MMPVTRCQSLNYADALCRIIIRLFQKALSAQPTLIFLDEIDALVGDRSSDEGGITSRQITNQLLAKWNAIRQVGAKVMMMGATNHPWDIDGASLRRFKERIHIGLPDMSVRLQLIKQALTDCDHTLSPAQMGIPGREVLHETTLM